MAKRKQQGNHIVVADPQCRPGVPLNHLEWIGKYVEEKSKHVTALINIGDHADMPSLSSYDKKKFVFEGRRFKKDVEASHLGNELLMGPIWESGAYENIESHITVGNHEERIARFANDNPELVGFIDIDVLEYDYYYDHVHDFLVPVEIDGVLYAHYFYNPMNGRPIGGMVETRLKNIGCTFTMGHQQGFAYGTRTLPTGKVQHGCIVGSSYLHDETYKGPQANGHWRGIIQKYGVHDGDYDAKIVRISSLCERYTGYTLETFMKKTDLHIGV